jgi:hypothetical protein
VSSRRTSALGGKEPNLRAAPDGAPGGSGRPSKLFQGSVPTHRGGGPPDPTLGIFRELCGSLGGAEFDSPGWANIVTTRCRMAHRDGERHDRHPGAWNQDEEHLIGPIRRLYPLVEGLRHTGSWLASRILPTSGCTDQNDWRPHVTAELAPLLRYNPRVAGGRGQESLCSDHTSAWAL